MIQHLDPEVVGPALRCLSNIVEKGELIDSVIESGLVNRLLLDKDKDDELDFQIEAVGALIDVTLGTTEQTRTVVDAGAVPDLIRLLNSDDKQLVENCVLALGNIAYDGDELGDVVISTGAIQPITRLKNTSCSKLVKK